MAALGKIRKRGVALVCIIGLGLFAFIAEEAFRSCEATKNQQRQQIGEVLGNKINVQRRKSSTASRMRFGTLSSTSRSSRQKPTSSVLPLPTRSFRTF